MLVAERKQLVLARLRDEGKIVARELAEELGISEASVRRDLRDLAAAGQCQRVYGGAVPVSRALALAGGGEVAQVAADARFGDPELLGEFAGDDLALFVEAGEQQLFAFGDEQLNDYRLFSTLLHDYAVSSRV